MFVVGRLLGEMGGMEWGAYMFVSLCVFNNVVYRNIQIYFCNTFRLIFLFGDYVIVIVQTEISHPQMME